MTPRLVSAEAHLVSVSLALVGSGKPLRCADLIHHTLCMLSGSRTETNVSRIAVPAHIIARIRAGEEVSAEEITAAQEAEARRLEKEARQAERGGKRPVGRSSQVASSTQQPGNEWIPEGHGRASPAGGKKSKSKRG